MRVVVKQDISRAPNAVAAQLRGRSRAPKEQRLLRAQRGMPPRHHATLGTRGGGVGGGPKPGRDDCSGLFGGGTPMNRSAMCACCKLYE